MYEGVIELPGGWRVPPDQAPELRDQHRISPELAFVRAHPFTVQRGGIKYPTPTKETHMPERLTKAQIEHELRLNTELINTLQRSKVFLQKQLATALPAEPPSSNTMFTVSVRFAMRGKRYQFLILRTERGYYTTGKDSHGYFPDWRALCQWLEGPDVYSHTALEILKSSGKGLSFETGRIENLDTGQAPF